MTNAEAAVLLAKELESFVKQQSIIIQKLVGVEQVPKDEPVSVGESIGQFDAISDAKQNAKEEEFGPEMTEEELAQSFGEKIQPKKVLTGKPLSKMSLDEIEAWERSQDNSNDVYKIKARVSNLARESGGQLTGQGEILANTYVHVLKSFYDFANSVKDSDLKIRLNQLIRSHENLPGMVISAAGAGIRNKKI